MLTNKLSSSYTERFSNDRRVIYRSGDYDCAGSILVYLHPEPNREEIEIKGPITTPIRIEVCINSVREIVEIVNTNFDKRRLYRFNVFPS